MPGLIVTINLDQEHLLDLLDAKSSPAIAAKIFLNLLYFEISLVYKVRVTLEFIYE